MRICGEMEDNSLNLTLTIIKNHIDDFFNLSEYKVL